MLWIEEEEEELFKVFPFWADEKGTAIMPTIKSKKIEKTLVFLMSIFEILAACKNTFPECQTIFISSVSASFSFVVSTNIIY